MATDEPMRCPECSEPLGPRQTPHGTVWVCVPCAAGAATMGVIRKVAPRGFVGHIWQAARSLGRESPLRCPSCTHPLLAFHAPEVTASPELQVCCRCFFIWLSRSSLQSLGLGSRARSSAREAAALLEVRAMAESARGVREAAILALAAAEDVGELLGSALAKSIR